MLFLLFSFRARKQKEAELQVYPGTVCLLILFFNVWEVLTRTRELSGGSQGGSTAEGSLNTPHQLVPLAFFVAQQTFRRRFIDSHRFKNLRNAGVGSADPGSWSCPDLTHTDLDQRCPPGSDWPTSADTLANATSFITWRSLTRPLKLQNYYTWLGLFSSNLKTGNVPFAAFNSVTLSLDFLPVEEMIPSFVLCQICGTHVALQRIWEKPLPGLLWTSSAAWQGKCCICWAGPAVVICSLSCSEVVFNGLCLCLSI